MMPDKETFIAMKIAAYREDDFSEGINHSLCKSCGGKCCKFSPCTLMPCDVSNMSPQGVKDMLDTGHYSIRVMKCGEAWNDCQDVMIQALLNETGNTPKQEYVKVCKNTVDIIFEKPEEQHTPYELNLINHCILIMWYSKSLKV